MQAVAIQEQAVGNRSFGWLPAAIIGVLFVLAVGMVHDLRVSAVLSSAPQEEVLVTSGESLWSVAESHAGEGATVDDLVRWMMAENHLESSLLQPGDRLVVPVLSS